MVQLAALPNAIPSFSFTGNGTQPVIPAQSNTTEHLRLADPFKEGVKSLYPRINATVTAMNDAVQGNDRRLQADVFPDLNQYATDTNCESPPTDFTFPRSDTQNCSVPFLWNDVSNPKANQTQADTSEFELTFNGLALGLTYENATDTNVDVCSYFRIADEHWMTAGHCFLSGVTPESFVILAAGYERANQDCIFGPASVEEAVYSEMSGETTYDPRTPVDDWGVVKTFPSTTTLDQNAYPIAQISTDLPDVGDTVFMLGHPAALPATWTKAKVIEVDTSLTGAKGEPSPTFKLDTSGVEGGSGGPVVKGGKVIGLVSSGIRERLTADADITDDGVVEFGPQRVVAVSMKGIAGNSAIFNNVVNQADTSKATSLLPEGMETDTCLFNVLQGPAITAALQLTEGGFIPTSEFGDAPSSTRAPLTITQEPTTQDPTTQDPSLAPTVTQSPYLRGTPPPTTPKVPSSAATQVPTYALGAVTATVALLMV